MIETNLQRHHYSKSVSFIQYKADKRTIQVDRYNSTKPRSVQAHIEVQNKEHRQRRCEDPGNHNRRIGFNSI